MSVLLQGRIILECLYKNLHETKYHVVIAIHIFNPDYLLNRVNSLQHPPPPPSWITPLNRDYVQGCILIRVPGSSESSGAHFSPGPSLFDS